MKFVADEGVEREIVLTLRELGFTIIYIAEDFPSIKDNQVLDIAVAEDVVLITADKDFGELVFKLKQKHNGIVLTRLPNDMPSARKTEIVMKVILDNLSELKDSFTVIQENFYRVRKPNQ